MDDRQIVELYLSRDERAIAETIAKYGTALHTLSYRIVQSDADADECTNDTYEKTWNSVPPHTPYTYLFAYLARIIRQISLNLVKHNGRQKRHATLVSLSEELNECLSPDSVDAAYDEQEAAAAISAFLRSLDPTARKIFIRRYWYMDPIAEISRNFGFTKGKVTSLLFRTRSALREDLKERGIFL